MSLKIIKLDKDELVHLNQFIDLNRNSIRYLNIGSAEINEEDVSISESSTRQLTKIVAKLDQLIHLSFISKEQYCWLTFQRLLKQIAVNCKQLTSFECNIIFEHGNYQLLSPLKEQRTQTFKAIVFRYELYQV